MKDPASRFPSLGSNAALADVQVRQTVALGLVPLGIALLLMAAMAPDPPAMGLWIGAGVSLFGMGLIWGLWRRSGHRYMRGFSTTHFLVRYLFIVLCPALLWVAFGAVIIETAGWFPPALMGGLLLLYPVGRILRERVDPDPSQTPRLEMARFGCQMLQMAMGVLALTGLLNGAVLNAHRDYPTDPTPLLLLLWLLAMLVLMAGAVMTTAYWNRLFGRPGPPQPLDDPPPPKPSGKAIRFGSEKY